MDFRPDLYRDLAKERMAEERELIEQRRLVRLSAGDPSPRARVARILFLVAFTVDSGSVWRALWEQLVRSEPTRSNVGR